MEKNPLLVENENKRLELCPLAHGFGWRNNAHLQPQGGNEFLYGGKFGVAIFGQGFIKSLTADSHFRGKIGHITSAGDIGQGTGDFRDIPAFKCRL